MWTDILWPFAVVTFEALVFAITLYLTRKFTRSRDAEWAAEEPAAGAQAGAVQSGAAGESKAPKPAPVPKPEPERAAQGREPVGAA